MTHRTGRLFIGRARQESIELGRLIAQIKMMMHLKLTGLELLRVEYVLARCMEHLDCIKQKKQMIYCGKFQLTQMEKEYHEFRYSQLVSVVALFIFLLSLPLPFFPHFAANLRHFSVHF